MVFSSIIFLFYFLPCFLLLYFVLPWKNAVLLVGSLVFYAWGEPRFVPLLLLSALLNYGCGQFIARSEGRARKRWLGVGIAANLGLLLYYKYLGFFGGMLNAVLERFHGGLDLPAVVLPLGISFFTFQGISYLIDVYRRDIAVQTSFLNFAMYKAMFPQLVAGPIVRYRQIAHEIEHRTADNARVWLGVRIFLTGLAQKVLIANTVAAPADRLFALPLEELTAPAAWIGIACYSIQILFDFAGYSNMAIGIGHMLGFSYPINFDRPYSARSITEFWRRWHISLSSWFRDYLYIPLGGNRVSPLRTYINLGLVFLLCGLWHGAAWTFIVWGVWHGAWLIIERAFLGAGLARLPGPLAQAWTLLLVMLGWVFFRADTLPHALHYIGAMFGQGAHGDVAHPWQMYFGRSAMTALLVGVLLAVWRGTAAPRAPARWWPPLRAAGLLLCFALCVVSLAAGTYNPFIYFRF
ncbi:MBOAT family protein [Duganella sp. FT80W]|uniref:Probable alginate O-acetylase AlgI n=1 Tax=Duganella guangzhouensis TaxID=2666084 RepID=A0A6I2KYA2_9BURK|nr:MBOAT family protein [Duganella guangzhouensis]MRW89176.1 MBOAT family protein [Duganella guangzhouensis]